MVYLYLKRNEKKVFVVLKFVLLYEFVIFVWIEDIDGMFEQWMVIIGIENKKEVEIFLGIKVGEKVVVLGVYFFKSESVIR